MRSKAQEQTPVGAVGGSENLRKNIFLLQLKTVRRPITVNYINATDANAPETKLNP
jgi:hypothetical protein